MGCSFAAALVLILAGLLIAPGECVASPPRIINLEKDDGAYVFDAYNNYVSINRSTTLMLSCEGDNPVTWTTPGRQDVDRRSKIESKTADSASRPYQSVITVENTVYTDTGRYLCRYLNDNEDADSANSADVYIFVNDFGHIFVEGNRDSATPIPMQQKSESLIPCLPSSLDAKVTLWRGSGSTRQQLNETFDPTKGFIISFPPLTFSGDFQCEGKLGDISEKLSFYLIVLAGTEFVPTPSIQTSAKHPTLNSDYTMTCGARAPADVYLYIEWTTPTLKGNRLSLGKETSKIIDMGMSGGKYRETKRSLTIQDVEEGDRGTYTCTVMDHNKNSNTKSTFLDVQSEEYSYLKLKLSGELDPNEAFESGLHGRANFVVAVDAFPQIPPPELHWFKGDRDLGKELNNKYEIKEVHGTTELIIYNLVRQDTGIYTLKGQVGNDIHEELNVTLFVIESPDVSFPKVTTTLYPAGKEFHLECLVEGCPTSDITWQWSSCPVGGGKCNRDFSVEVNETGVNQERVAESGELRDGCYLRSVLTGRVNRAGYYRCSAVSLMGSNSSETPVYITEFPSKFGINASDDKPFEQDSLTLFCYASLFYYSTIQWMWSANDGSQLRPLTNNTNVEVVSSATRYSLISTATIYPTVRENSGYYSCQAQSIDNAQKDFKNFAVSVQRLISPVVIETNLNSSTYVLYNEDSFEFVCKVDGSPPPKLTWYRNSTVIGNNESAMLFLENYTKLQIPRIVSADAGHYLCIAHNRAGSLMLNATLTVLDVSRSSGLSIGGIATIASVVALIFIIAAVLGTCYGRRVYKDRKEKRELDQFKHMLFDQGDLGSYNPDLPLDEQVDALPYDKRWEFPKEQLKFGRTIGQGAFGRVVKAEATNIVPGETNTTVAVKMLKERADNEQRKALMQELKIMIHIGRHINVVNLLGAITKNIYKGELQVIVEYCHFGNLRHYLLRNRENFINQVHASTGEVDVSVHNIPSRAEFIRDSSRFSGGPNSSMSSGTMSDGTTGNINQGMDSAGTFENPRLSAVKGASSRHLTTCDLLSYAYQTCNGMKYLSSNKLVHRDLALRNILLSEGDIVKICDFGLAKDCYKTSYYRKKTQGPLPVKWMSIESIRDKVFSTESDVWSYGIVLWEMFTLGANPYPAMEVDEDFYRKLAGGYRMEKPEFAPKSQYDLMRECWRNDPKSRPSFVAILDRLASILGSGAAKRFSELNDEYVKLGSAFSSPHYISMMPTSSSPDLQGVGPDYVNVDTAINIRPQEGAVNYINMAGSPTGASPPELTSPTASPLSGVNATVNGNPKATVYGDRHSREDELEPMMLEDGSDFYRSPPEPVPVGVGPNPFATSGYLDMGGKINNGSVSSSPPEVLLRAAKRKDPSSPPPRYTDVIAAESAFAATAQ